MKQYLTKFALLCASALMLFVSCEKDKPDGGDPDSGKNNVEFKLTSSAEMTFEAAGGAGKIQYELKNAAQDGVIDITPKDGWVSSFDTNTPGEINFTVSENTVREDRSCTLKVSYNYDGNSSKFFEVVIKQSAAPGIPQGDAFVITIDEKSVTFATAGCTVVPNDKDMTFISMVVKKSIVEKFEGNDEAWFEDDMLIFESQASMYGISLKDYVENYKLQKGELNYTASGLTPSTEYWCYAYGMEFDESGNPVMLTSITKKEFTTATPSADPDQFTLEVSAIGETGIQLLVVPYSDDVLYYYDNIPGDNLDKYSGTMEEKLAQYGYDYIHPLLGMWGIEDFGWYGSQAKSFWNIHPTKTYYAFAYILNDDGGAKDGKVWYQEYSMPTLKSPMRMVMDLTRPEAR